MTVQRGLISDDSSALTSTTDIQKQKTLLLKEELRLKKEYNDKLRTIIARNQMVLDILRQNKKEQQSTTSASDNESGVPDRWIDLTLLLSKGYRQ